MKISEPIRVIIESANKTSESNEYISLIITSLITLLIAVFTSWLMRKNELSKIKAEQEILSKKIDSELKQIVLAIESENYRELYKIKLEALKKIKTLQFTIIEVTQSQGEQYGSVMDYMQDFDFRKLRTSLYDLILDYSHIFNSTIVKKMKDIYNDVEYTEMNYEPELSGYTDFYDTIHADFKELEDLISSDLNVDFENIKIK